MTNLGVLSANPIRATPARENCDQKENKTESPFSNGKSRCWAAYTSFQVECCDGTFKVVGCGPWIHGRLGCIRDLFCLHVKICRAKELVDWSYLKKKFGIEKGGMLRIACPAILSQRIPEDDSVIIISFVFRDFTVRPTYLMGHKERGISSMCFMIAGLTRWLA